MSEYIEREAAEKVASKYGCTNGVVIGRHSGLADCIALEIAKLPAAEVVPVRMGGGSSRFLMAKRNWTPCKMFRMRRRRSGVCKMELLPQLRRKDGFGGLTMTEYINSDLIYRTAL